jgi:predicted nucleotidyltransferase
VTRSSVQAIVTALNANGVRYLVAGGLAVVAHGLVRFTADIDLVLDPEAGSTRRAIKALQELGYRPRAPVAFEDFADAGKRAAWVREKGLMVFSLHSAEHGATEVDLFVEPPFEFESTYSRAHRVELAPGVEVTFVGLADLIDMKRKAGRPRDVEDITGLESLGAAGGASDE